MALFSISIQAIVLSLVADTQVPWGPHYGFILTRAENSRSIQGTVLVTPAPLPFEDYHKKLPSLTQYDQLHIITKSQKKASHLLQVQKKKTGVAILGSPCPELSNNPIFQGDLKHCALEVGEDLARKALAAELRILFTAGIPPAKTL